MVAGQISKKTRCIILTKLSKESKVLYNKEKRNHPEAPSKQKKKTKLATIVIQLSVMTMMNYILVHDQQH